MAKIFLDTNKFIDLAGRDPETTSVDITGHQVFTSTLSYHIRSYIDKIPMPNQSLYNSLGSISAVSFDEDILKKSLQGPTIDLEDNIQLNSAAKESCDYFLTSDKRLLKMRYYGNTEIINKLNN